MARLPPQPLYAAIGLSLTAPTASDPGTEVVGGGYVRRVVQFLDAEDAAEVLCNAMTFEWPRATSRWGEVGWVTAWDLDGNYLGWYGPTVDPSDEITALPILIDIGDVLRVKAGDLMITPTGGKAPRPFGVGGFGLGPYSTNYRAIVLTAILRDTFAASGSPCCPGSANWQEAVL